MIEDFKNEFDKVLQALKKELSGVRTNRPSAALVESLKVNYYGQSVLLNTLATIGIQPPRTIQIQVWDQGAVKEVVHAIEASSLNLTANQDGNTIRINLPELSSERREELGRHVKKIVEEHRIQLRHLRDEANKKIQSTFDSGELNEDQKFKSKEEVQKAIDKVNQEIESALSNKIKEIQS